MNLARGITTQFTPERLEKRFSHSRQFSLQAFRAIAVTASPRFRTILITAASPVMCVLHLRQLEISLPIWTLFLEGDGTIADLNPARRLVRTKPGVFHVA